jgi:hypothetical protein
MLRTSSTVLALLVALTSAAPAFAGITNNGITNNGVTNNGITNNGITNNGITNNGVDQNGATADVAIRQMQLIAVELAD